ncbi:MAG: iron complex outermembrane receptor protein [Paraglaciecola sp.]|jgi:iron complex outermembrane receptor protein
MLFYTNYPCYLTPVLKTVLPHTPHHCSARLGTDHPVATETTKASHIEVLIGPATLLYASGATGGINVVDNRLPATRQQGLSGEKFAQYD